MHAMRPLKNTSLLVWLYTGLHLDQRRNMEDDMSSQSGRRRTLAVCANGTENHVAVPRGESTWGVVPCSSLEQILELTQEGELDAVALPFDLMDANSADNFLAFANVQTDKMPLLVSYSSFNPNWIENRAAGLGISVHLKGGLDLPVIFDALDEHLQHQSPAETGTEALT